MDQTPKSDPTEFNRSTGLRSVWLKLIWSLAVLLPTSACLCGLVFYQSQSLKVVETRVNDVGEVNLVESPNSVIVRDNFAYFADNYNGLVILDVADPKAPALAGRIDIAWYDCNNPYHEEGLCADSKFVDIAVQGNYAYLAQSKTNDTQVLMIVDISDPTQPQTMSAYPIEGSPHWQQLTVVGNYVFIAGGGDGLRIIEVSDPVHPVEIGAYRPPLPDSLVLDVQVVDQYAYLATKTYFEGDCVLIDLSVPDHPKEVSFEEAMLKYEQNKNDRHEYSSVCREAPSTQNNLVILDVSDPTKPVEVNSISPIREIEKVVIQGEYAYLLLDFGLQIMDISEPAEPIELSVLETEDYCNILAIDGAHAYIVTGSKIHVIDISDPTNPFEIDDYVISWSGSRSGTDIAVSEGFLFYVGMYQRSIVSDLKDGLVIIQTRLP